MVERLVGGMYAMHNRPVSDRAATFGGLIPTLDNRGLEIGRVGPCNVRYVLASRYMPRRSYY